MLASVEPARAAGKLHGVTIRRELRHSDQINKSEHAGTDRLRKYALFFREIYEEAGRDHPRPVQAWGRVGMPHGANASPIASNAAREIRSDPQRLLDENPHLPNRKPTRCHHICRELRHSDQI